MGFYLMITAAFTFAGLLWAILSYSDMHQRGVQNGLAVFLFAWTWPIALPLALCYGVYNLFRFALTGKS